MTPSSAGSGRARRGSRAAGRSWREPTEVLEAAGVELDVRGGHVEQPELVMVAPDDELAQGEGVGTWVRPEKPARNPAAAFISSEVSVGSHRTSEWVSMPSVTSP